MNVQRFTVMEAERILEHLRDEAMRDSRDFLAADMKVAAEQHAGLANGLMMAIGSIRRARATHGWESDTGVRRPTA